MAFCRECLKGTKAVPAGVDVVFCANFMDKQVLLQICCADAGEEFCILCIGRWCLAHIFGLITSLVSGIMSISAGAAAGWFCVLERAIGKLLVRSRA